MSSTPSNNTLNHGTLNGDGSYTLTPSQLAVPSLISNREPHPFPTRRSSDLTDGGDAATAATTSTSLHVDVTPVADAPSLSTAAASGNEDTAIALDIKTGRAHV